MKNTTNTTRRNPYSLVERIKRQSTPLFKLFPINHRTKYPIFFNKLFERIHDLKVRYKKADSVKVFQNTELSRQAINGDLKNKGGVYLWWCKPTGLFYIGSANSFVGKNGRLNEYFQKNRLLKTINSKISSDVSKDMLKYPKSDWTLVILEDLGLTINLESNNLKEAEQLWMLLIPTYNRSLVVGSNEGLPLSEEKREIMSTLIYVYEVSNFMEEAKLVPNFEQRIYGIKELSRIGLKSKLSNLTVSVSTWDIQAHLLSGLPLKNKFILSQKPLTLDEQLSWKIPAELSKNSCLGVWVYDFNSLNFIEYFNNVKDCRDKYQIPSTTFKRVRKHRLNCKGFLFSNYKI